MLYRNEKSERIFRLLSSTEILALRHMKEDKKKFTARYASALSDIAKMRIITDPTYAEWVENRKGGLNEL